MIVDKHLTKKTDTEALWKKDKEHVVHPYTNFERFATEGAVVYSSGKDHFIYDNDGKEYLDGLAGLWCVNIGHGRSDLAQDMAKQAEKLAYYNTFGDATSPPAAQLAAKLAELAPSNLNKVFFGTGGSMANDTAVKIAHYYFNIRGEKQKKKIISRDLAYHGSTYLAHALTGISSTHIGFDLATDLVEYLSAPYPYRKPEGLSDDQFCVYLIQEFKDLIHRVGAKNIAAYIAEPIMGAGGVIVPPKDYNRGMWELCKENQILYISDEVVTAFGRLGHMMTSESVFDVKPDMLVLAKGISSGYIPLGATMISDDIYEVISQPKLENPYFSHGFTYSGHALACAVGHKNIEIMQSENFCKHVQNLGPYFETKLKTLEELPIVGEVRGSHFMLCIENVKNKETKEPFANEIEVSKRIYHHSKEKGLIIRPIGSLIVLSPPLTYDKAAIDKTVSILGASIEATILDLKKEGIC